MEGNLKYLRLLSHEFPTRQAVYTEIINLEAILNRAPRVHTNGRFVRTRWVLETLL